VCSYRFDEEDDSLVLKAQSEKQMLEISVPLPKIFRFIDSMGLNDKIFDEELYAIKLPKMRNKPQSNSLTSSSSCRRSGGRHLSSRIR